MVVMLIVMNGLVLYVFEVWIRWVMIFLLVFVLLWMSMLVLVLVMYVIWVSIVSRVG